MKPLSREDEIRRKIMQLKKAGKIKESTSAGSAESLASYEDKVKQKLGKKKSRLLGLGYNGGEDDDEISRIQAELDSIEDEKDDIVNEDSMRQGRIGSLPELEEKEEEQEPAVIPPSPTTITTDSDSSKPKKPLIDPSLFEDSEKPEMSEADLVDLVEQKLSEKWNKEAAATEAAAAKAVEELEASVSVDKKEEDSAEKQKKTTTGVGGKWIKDQDNSTDYYKPKSGSWGAFPRPKDISKAYGGGRRVGVGFSKEDDAVGDMRTKKLLKDYRIKVGIEVPTEKEHAAEIEEALQIGQLAMQRGVYATAVSALEKVTRWCSTNSPVGSKVFLELAMAYEAVGRTQEAYQVYQTLTKCRMEDVKHNAKRLLYGMEAMEIMRDISSDFSRSKIKNTFIDTTGLGNIAQNFDDVYQTAYIDLDSGYYKRLTQSVVRSHREARQVLLQAAGRGEVGRLKVVQALRNIARHFDDALESEIAANTQREPTAYLDGKPLVVYTAKPESTNTAIGLDEFVLASSEQMMNNLQGTWRLQLLADKQGDGVSFFNTSTAIQEFSTKGMSFSASGPSGLVTLKSSGDISMEDSKRILTRSNVQNPGGVGAIFSMFSGGKDSGFLAAVSREQQIMSVDSVLFITKCAPGSRKGKDAEKEHFGVWRKVLDVGP
jgi:hypothetical protein